MKRMAMTGQVVDDPTEVVLQQGTMDIEEPSDDVVVVDDDKDKLRRKMLNRLVNTGKCGFTNIQLFNSILESGTATSAIDNLSSHHENLLGLHGFMAGFQFVVIGGDFSKDSTVLEKVVLTTQTVGFLLSLMGTLLSLIAVQFFNTLKEERVDVQVNGVHAVFPYVRNSDFLAIVAACLLACSTIVSMFDKLPWWICVPVGLMAGLGFVMFGYLFMGIILSEGYDWSKNRHMKAYATKRGKQVSS